MVITFDELQIARGPDSVSDDGVSIVEGTEGVIHSQRAGCPVIAHRIDGLTCLNRQDLPQRLRLDTGNIIKAFEVVEAVKRQTTVGSDRAA